VFIIDLEYDYQFLQTKTLFKTYSQTTTNKFVSNMDSIICRKIEWMQVIVTYFLDNLKGLTYMKCNESEIINYNQINMYMKINTTQVNIYEY